MKKIIFILITLIVSFNLFAQSVNFFKQMKKYDLCKILSPDSITGDENIKFKMPEPLGYIGTNYQRFQFHIISIKKSSVNPYQYLITGKTRVKNYTCKFSGTITIINAELDSWKPSLKDIGYPNYREGTITSIVKINEDSSETFSGYIKGKLLTEIYIDKNQNIYYNDLMLVADGFSNNQFEGKWTSYKTGKVKNCNWGDFRIPNSKYLDCGAGEFIPSDKYLDFGWRSYYDASVGNSDSSATQYARKIEDSEWWK